MKAAVFRDVRDLVVTEVPDPVAGPRDIVVSVGAAGICGSDVTSYRTGAYIRAGTIMGHEFAGSISALGDEVTGLRMGQRVTIRPLGRCGQCAPCISGNWHVCASGIREAIGYGHAGAFAEYVRIPNAAAYDNVFPLEDSVTDSQGAMVEPYAVALHASRRLGATASGTYVVLGLGPIGLATIQVLRSLGADRIVGVDSSSFRRQRSLEAGAATACDSGDMLEALHEVTPPSRRGDAGTADAILDASGSVELVQAAPALLATGGRLGLVALYREQLALGINDWVTRELELVGCFGYGQEFAEALDMITDARLDTELLLTGSFPIESISEAMDAQANANRHVKIHVRPRDPTAT